MQGLNYYKAEQIVQRSEMKIIIQIILSKTESLNIEAFRHLYMAIITDNSIACNGLAHQAPNKSKSSLRLNQTTCFYVLLFLLWVCLIWTQLITVVTKWFSLFQFYHHAPEIGLGRGNQKGSKKLKVHRIFFRKPPEKIKFAHELDNMMATEPKFQESLPFGVYRRNTMTHCQ